MLAATVLLSIGSPSRATPGAEVRVNCPELASEMRSSLEARTRAQLALKNLQTGHVHIDCAQGRVRVEFESSSGAIAEQVLALSGEPATWVETILALVHQLTSPASETSPASVSEFPSEAAATTATTEPTTPPSTPLVPPVATTTSPATPPAASASQSTPDSSSATRGRPATELRFEPGLGLCSELWTNEPLLLLGPCASFGARLAQFRVAPTLGFAWASAKPDGISLATTTLGLETTYGERWWVGGGFQLSWSHLDAPEELSPETETLLEPALTIRGGYMFTSSVHRFVVGLGLRVAARYREVRVDSTPVFVIPILAPLAAVEYRLAF